MDSDARTSSHLISVSRHGRRTEQREASAKGELNEDAPLLDLEGREGSGRRPRGTATSAQTLGNIIVSIVGTGVLGLPYAFRMAGWIVGSLGVAIAGLATFYCMLLLVYSHTFSPLLSPDLIV